MSIQQKSTQPSNSKVEVFIDDFSLIREKSPKFSGTLDWLSEISKAIENAFKVGVIVGPVVGFVALAFYLNAENAMDAALDTLGSAQMLIATLVISTVTTVAVILGIGIPAYSNFMINATAGYSPPVSWRMYMLEFSATILMVAHYYFAVAFDAPAQWNFLTILWIFGGTLLSALYAQRKNYIPKKGFFELWLSLFLANAISMLWLVAIFLVSLKPSEFLATVIVERLGYSRNELAETVIAYSIYTLVIFGLLALHFFINKGAKSQRIIRSLAVIATIILAFGYPGFPSFTAYGLQMLGMGGGLPITLISVDNSDSQRYGCLILATPSRYIFKETGNASVCSRNYQYILFERRVRSTAHELIRIVPADKYERRYRVESQEET